ncbi:MAG: HlyD family efflux transporter periplasmic adaptor subunit, partial [Novosphingobium sp.]
SHAALVSNRAESQRLANLLAAPSGASDQTAVAVHAPAGGMVLSVINESEGIVAEGAPLMTIGDPASIEAVIDLLSREAVQVRPGDPVEFSQWGGEGPLLGKVQRIEPFGRLKISALGIEEQRVNVIVAFDAENAGKAARLGHGYQVDATIVLWRSQDALRVPIGALFRGTGGDWQVFVMDTNHTRARTVKLGHINDSFGEVLGGLREGETVIVNPSAALSDGTRVTGR